MSGCSREYVPAEPQQPPEVPRPERGGIVLGLDPVLLDLDGLDLPQEITIERGGSVACFGADVVQLVVKSMVTK